MEALSSATVIVEAGQRSGSLEVARQAKALHRVVGAVPGPVTSAASAGAHRLLREGVARVVTGTTDVLALIESRHPAPPSRAATRDSMLPERRSPNRSPRTTERHL